VQIPAGTEVQVIRKDGSKFLVRRAGSEAFWVGIDQIELAEAMYDEEATPPVQFPSGIESNNSSEAISPGSEKSDLKTFSDNEEVKIQNRTFQIKVLGKDVEVEQIGNGKVGVIFFSHTGDLGDYIRDYIGLDSGSVRGGEAKSLLQTDYTFFLWKYPAASPFDKIEETMDAFYEDRKVSLDFFGVATSVLDQVRRASELNDFLLVGNSLGAGVLLYDHKNLASRSGIKFLLISPTEMFSPSIRNIGDLRNTTLVANPDGDSFIRSSSMKDWIAKNRHELTDALDDFGHLIIGSGVSFPQLCSLLLVASNKKPSEDFFQVQISKPISPPAGKNLQSFKQKPRILVTLTQEEVQDAHKSGGTVFTSNLISRLEKLGCLVEVREGVPLSEVDLENYDVFYFTARNRGRLINPETGKLNQHLATAEVLDRLLKDPKKLLILGNTTIPTRAFRNSEVIKVHASATENDQRVEEVIFENSGLKKSKYFYEDTQNDVEQIKTDSGEGLVCDIITYRLNLKNGRNVKDLERFADRKFLPILTDSLAALASRLESSNP